MDRVKVVLLLVVGNVFFNIGNFFVMTASHSPMQVTMMNRNYILMMTGYQAMLLGMVGVPLIILVGIWLHSNVVRFIGASIFAFALVVFLIREFSYLQLIPSWYFAMQLAQTSLIVASIYLLVFSRKFKTDFAKARSHELLWQTRLRQTLHWLLLAPLAAVIYLTAEDLYYFLRPA